MRFLKSFNENITKDTINKRAFRSGKNIFDYKDTKMYIISERDDIYMTITIGIEKEPNIHDESYTFDIESGFFDDKEILEIIENVYDNYVYSKELKKEKDIKISKGAKNISFDNIKYIMNNILDGYVGNKKEALTGSEYINFNNKIIRFSDHTRPPMSKWNSIHGENHIDSIKGLICVDKLIKWFKYLTNNNITSKEIAKIESYFSTI